MVLEIIFLVGIPNQNFVDSGFVGKQGLFGEIQFTSKDMLMGEETTYSEELPRLKIQVFG